MDRSPTVSVVIPVHNGRRYLRRSVASALEQTHEALEVIVVDDGSCDCPKDVLAGLLGRVQLVQHGISRGVSAARNTGIRAASGDLVAFLDSDDWWHTDRLRHQVELHSSQHDVALSFCDFVHVTESGEPTGWQGGLLEACRERGLTIVERSAHTYLLGRDALWALLEFTSFMHPSTVICKRTLFETTGFFDEALGTAEDLDMWLRVAATSQLALLDENLVFVEQRPGSLGHNLGRMADGMLEVYRTALDRYPDLPPRARAAVIESSARQHRSLAWLALEGKDWGAARRHALAALRQKPSLEAATLVGRSLVLPLVRGRRSQ